MPDPTEREGDDDAHGPEVRDVIYHSTDGLALYARDFGRLMESHPELKETIEQVATERLGEDG